MRVIFRRSGELSGAKGPRIKRHKQQPALVLYRFLLVIGGATEKHLLPQGDSHSPPETLEKQQNPEPALQIPVHSAPLNLDTLAAELFKLPKEERARLVALMLGMG